MSALPVFPEASGIDYDMPHDEYLAALGLGSSAIKKILRSGAHYKASIDCPQERTSAFDVGSATHMAVLEPARFADSVIAAPKFDRRTKEGKASAAAFEAECAGRLVLDSEDFDTARRAADSVLAHPAARALLVGGKPEVSMFWRDAETDVACKLRADYLREDMVVVDLKTTVDASKSGFSRSIEKFGYAIQAAHYARGIYKTTGQQMGAWVFIAVEKELPYAVGCYVLDVESIIASDARVAKALERFKQCVDSGVWPAYSDLIEPISLPAWALNTKD
jgi:exodeoxyribonuclease VIII